MIKYGKIVVLLNEEQLLVELFDNQLGTVEIGMSLTVFAHIKDIELLGLELPPIFVPKGKIRVLVQQSDSVFLAERYKEGGRVERKPIAAVDFFTQEVRIGAQWSAEIDPQDTLGIEYERSLKVGDVVGEI